MRFFMSGELDSEIADQYRVARKLVETKLNETLGAECYGEALLEISIIPIILGPRFIQGKTERRLIKHKEKTADYRLFIDFTQFKDGSPSDRVNLLLANVLSCVDDIAAKLGSQLDAQRLKNDIKKLFSEFQGVP